MTKQVFVLKTTRFGEADLFVSVLDKRGCRMKLVARGAQKSRKRFPGGALQPTHLILASIADREKDGIRTLTEAQVVNGFEKIRESYEKLQGGLAIVKWVERVALEAGEDNQGLFDLLGHALNQMAESENSKAVQIHFMVRLYLFLGMLPSEDLFEEFAKTPMAHHQRLSGDWDIEKVEKGLRFLESKLG